MILETYVAGLLGNNNYLLIDEESKEAVLIDCSEYVPEIKDFLAKYDAKLKYVLVTHGHFDHILGIKDLKESFSDTQIIAPINDKELIEGVGAFVDRFVGGLGNVEIPHIDKYISDNDELIFGGKKIKTISTPGHTKGSVCYFIDDKLFSGDTIFLESVGRTDLPGGSYEQIKSSVEKVLKSFDDAVKIYPGHGPSTTVEYEKKNNPVI